MFPFDKIARSTLYNTINQWCEHGTSLKCIRNESILFIYFLIIRFKWNFVVLKSLFFVIILYLQHEYVISLVALSTQIT